MPKKKPPPKSKRADGRGHWPAGIRRNPDHGKWGRLRLALARFLTNHYSPAAISARRLAEDVGVSDRTVRRWLSGENRPSPELQAAVEAWLAEWRESL